MLKDALEGSLLRIQKQAAHEHVKQLPAPPQERVSDTDWRREAKQLKQQQDAGTPMAAGANTPTAFATLTKDSMAMASGQDSGRPNK